MTAGLHRAVRAAATIGWAAAALLASVLLLSTFRVDYVWVGVPLALVALACVAAWRPYLALVVVAAATPVAWFVVSRQWNSATRWADTVVMAAAAGWCAREAVRRPAVRVDARLTTPAGVFAALIVCACAAALDVDRLTLGPRFGALLTRMVTRDYFLVTEPFGALHAGLLLLQGLLLFYMAARMTQAAPQRLRQIAAAAAAGGAVAAAANVSRLAMAAAREPAAAGRLLMTRVNVHYQDLNAAGSYFVMVLFVAAGLAIVSRTRRAPWIAASLAAAAGLWISGSRAGMLAGVLAAAVALVIMYPGGARARTPVPDRPGPATPRTAVRRAAAVVSVAMIAAIGLAVALPKRGNQTSSTTAVRVRAELAQTSARMIAAHPVFGIGLAEFRQRSGEFSSPELLNAFPPAVHENAHNNLLQITAELGLVGGLVFVWLVTIALVRAAANAIRRRDRLAVAAFGGLLAFVLTWLGGHPLLLYEPAYAFWILIGAVTATDTPRPAGRWTRFGVAAALIVLLATLPARARALKSDVELEHLGFGVSPWQTTGDVERYRTAVNTATLFVPSDTGFRFRLKPLTDAPVHLELTLDGRVADVVVLMPNEWTMVTMPERTQRRQARSARLDLRLLTAPDREVTMRIGKVERVASR